MQFNRMSAFIIGIATAALCVAPSGAVLAQTATTGASATTRQQHADRAPEKLSDRVDHAEDIIDRWLDLSQAGSTAPKPNTLIAVHRSDLVKLRDELKGITQLAPAAAGNVDKATMAAHIKEAKRIANRLGRTDRTGNTAVATSGQGSSTPPPTAKGGASPQHDSIITVDKTKLRELKDQIEAIERLAPRS